MQGALATFAQIRIRQVHMRVQSAPSLGAPIATVIVHVMEERFQKERPEFPLFARHLGQGIPRQQAGEETLDEILRGEHGPVPDPARLVLTAVGGGYTSAGLVLEVRGGVA